MRNLFIFIFFSCVHASVNAQINPCFDERLQSGLSAFNEKDYNKAIKFWQIALDNCEPDYKQSQKLKDYISQAKNALNNNTSITTHYSIEPEIVLVAGGSFEMGSNGDEENNKLEHGVTLNSYYIGKYEVTQKQWRDLMGSDPAKLSFSGCDDCPVERVNWEEVQNYLKKLNLKTGKNYRLPTEAEWEFAARGGNALKNYKYSGSDDISDVAWYTDNSNGKTHPVGKRQANELGIYDMTGNVWEWCNDWYDENYYERSPAQNPPGAASGTYRVSRGGGWGATLAHCRVDFRYKFKPSLHNNRIGFRVALSSQ